MYATTSLVAFDLAVPARAGVRRSFNMGLLGTVFGRIDAEQPKYTVEAAKEGYEIRLYEPQLRAEVSYETQKGSHLEANLNSPFGILAGYIFGKNTGVKGEGSDRIEMTAPVVLQAAQPEKIAMTAPVVMQEGTTANSKAQRTMAFILPASKYTSIDQLPKPKDERVKFVEVPASKLAVITFSANMNGQEVKKEAELRELCARDNIKLSTDPKAVQFCGYNPPWTPWFWRKNEVMIPCDV